jgi:succinoglycan biosynthesis protein ExoM
MESTAQTGSHISVCVCTFKRPAMLRELLERLGNQLTEGLFTYSVVVADNDAAQSAREVVDSFVSASQLSVKYCFETEQNIALARNKSIENAIGDFIAFIDDDEFPVGDWLLNLFKTRIECKADGVLGPVKPYFEVEPQSWVIKGKFFERPSHPTGFHMNWSECRTGNVLFSKSILKEGEPPFRSQFDTAGEDVDFFRRMSAKGCSFVWSDEAAVYEVVPASRATRTYLLRKALLRGSNFSKHPTDKLKNTVTSLIAVPVYALALPFLALFGQHVFIKYLIKFLDHFSRLMAFIGLRLVTQRQT